MDSTLDCTKTDVRFSFFMTKSVHVILAHFEVRFALAENKKETEEEEEMKKKKNCSTLIVGKILVFILVQT